MEMWRKNYMATPFYTSEKDDQSGVGRTTFAGMLKRLLVIGRI